MEKQIISTEKAPKAIGPYSQAVKVGNLVYTSGQLPMNAQTGELIKVATYDYKGEIDNLLSIGVPKVAAEIRGVEFNQPAKSKLTIASQNNTGQAKSEKDAATKLQ